LQSLATAHTFFRTCLHINSEQLHLKKCTIKNKLPEIMQRQDTAPTDLSKHCGCGDSAMSLQAAASAAAGQE